MVKFANNIGTKQKKNKKYLVIKNVLFSSNNIKRCQKLNSVKDCTKKITKLVRRDLLKRVLEITKKKY